MKLYHYIKKGNKAQKEGILSFAKNPNASLSYYVQRSGGKTTHQEICAWLESCFKGRSRAIRGFTEPIRWTKRSVHCLKDFVDNTDTFEIDISAMDHDGLIEAVYISPAVSDIQNIVDKQGIDEVLYKLNSIAEINYAPIDWDICDDELGRRFAWVRYYLIVVKGGIIPPQYIKMINLL